MWLTINMLCCAVLCLVTQSCPTLCNLMDCSPPGSSVHGDSPGKNTGVGCNALLQGTFPTQGLNPGLPHCRWIRYQLSYQGSPINMLILPKYIIYASVQFSSIAQSCPTLWDPMNHSTPGLPVHRQLPEFTQTHASSQWCHPTISSSVVPFSSCPQSLPASESFPMSQL